MKSGTYLPVFACCATIAFAQTTANPSRPSTQAPPASAPGQLKPRGPDAMAQQDPKRVIATIAGKPITAEEAAKLLKIVRPEDMKRFAAANQMPKLLQEVYMQGQFAEQAAALHLDEQPPFKEEIRVARENILAQAYISRITNTGGPAPDLKAYYDSHQGDFEQIKVSGIFISFSPAGAPSSKGTRTEEQALAKANELEQKIKGGADFALLAKTESDNQASAARNGEIGTFTGSDTALPADIKKAIFALKAGEVSQPIREQTGFYILKAETRTKKPFEQASGEILEKIQREKGQVALQTEMQKYAIVVQDQDFFDAVAPTTASPKTPSLVNPSGTGAAASKPPAKP